MKQAYWLRTFNCLALAVFAFVPNFAAAQTWKPERPIELMVGCAPGCDPDNMVRFMQRMFQTNRYFDVPVTIQNKAGGMGADSRRRRRRPGP